ncbi:unnamed protein product [Meloidogyne enterolobii]|uniref:Uncharacterized protein n=1 Tax=Meloidogyne enterolobii TaxID=390850 RepID=A0ACB0ZQ85_MELEN
MCATEYLNYEDQKFSKSRGVGVFGDTVSQIGIPADVLRFYLIYMRPEGQDTSFCWEDLVLKVNSELLANLGNFVHRALSFLSSFFSGIQPNIELTSVEDELFTLIDQDLKEFISAMEDVRMRDALHQILSVSRRGNQYMQVGQPWLLVKSDKKEDKQRAQTIIGVSANLSLFLSIMLQPFMPKTSASIREQCNIPLPMVLPEHFTLLLKTGHQHNKPSPLFAKIEPSKVGEWKALFGGDQNSTTVNGTLVNNKTSPKKTKQQNQQKKSKMASSDAVDLSSIDINKLYNEVLAKFQKAKEIFVAKEMTRLDSENKALREQIEEFKIKLGYVGPLFSPPKTSSSAPIKTIPKENSKSDVLKQPSQITTSTVDNGENVVQKPKQGKKSENKKAAASNVDTAGGGEIDVGRLDLRVGRILKATKHPDADALYVEEIDLGEEKPRTVVSGLVRFVPLEEMQNRLVVCLCNLKPAKMRGVESQAMVMCASTPEKVEILEIDSSCEPGDVVMCEPFAHRPDLPFMNPKKKIWEGVAPDLSVSENGECVYKGHQLRVFRNGSSLKARTLSNVPVK